MKCPTISGIEFSPTSIRSIKEIRRIRDLSNYLILISGGGHLLNIFLGSGPIQATYSLQSTNFQVMTEAMSGVPAMTRRVITDIAGRTCLKVTNHKEKTFWHAIYLGCRAN